MKETINKSFTTKPFAVTNEHYEVIDIDKSLEKIKYDVQLIADSVYLVCNSSDYDKYLKLVLSGLDESGEKLPPQSSNIGRRLGSEIPEESLPYFTANVSRYKELFNGSLINTIKSHAERIKRSEGEGYVSAGYKRTLNTNKAGTAYPKVSYSAADRQVTSIDIIDNVIIWSVKTQGEWLRFYFKFDNERFKGASRISLPDVQVTDGEIEFRFAAVYDYISSEISSEYAIGVDVGIAKYVTASVTHGDEVIVTTTLSERFNRDYARYKRQYKKFSDLAAKLKNPERLLAQDSIRRARRATEYKYLREKISRTRRELAILAAQELADLSWCYDNAVIVFENLTWRKDTMDNGRWNIGELMKWVKHYQHLNGSRVAKTKAAYTSQLCSHCGSGEHSFSGRVFVCKSCQSRIDRDANASVNIARRGSITARKIAKTRSENIKKRTSPKPAKLRRTPKRRETLGYQGQCRFKEVKNHGITRVSNNAVTVRVNDARTLHNGSGAGIYDRDWLPDGKNDNAKLCSRLS